MTFGTPTVPRLLSRQKSPKVRPPVCHTRPLRGPQVHLPKAPERENVVSASGTGEKDHGENNPHSSQPQEFDRCWREWRSRFEHQQRNQKHHHHHGDTAEGVSHSVPPTRSWFGTMFCCE